MEEKQLELIVRQIVEKILSEQQSDLEKEPLAIIQTAQHSFSQLNEATRHRLSENYTCQLLTLEEANQLAPPSSLLLDLPLTVQAKAALGIADCEASIFLQQAFISGQQVAVLSDDLVDLNEIASLDYRKQFVHYQRQLKEFGLRFVSQATLSETKKTKQLIVEKDVQQLAKSSTLKVSKNALLSYGAKQLLKEKNIRVIRE